jgi:P pilus assembly chaperone PapD
MSAAVIAAAATLGAATPAYALLVQPIVIDLSTTGQGSSAAITVTNDRNRPDTIEVTINKLTLPEKGAPELTPDPGSEFLIFPPASTIEPGKTQVFRVRWIGDPKLAQSKSYMFAISELPVNQVQGSGVQVLYSIQSLVTVTPPGLKPDVSVATAARDTQSTPAGTASASPTSNTAGIAVTFQNAGNAVDYISHYQVALSIDGSKWSKTFDAAETTKAVGLGLIQPNSKRTIFFPVPDVPASGDIKVKLDAVSKN